MPAGRKVVYEVQELEVARLTEENAASSHPLLTTKPVPPPTPPRPQPLGFSIPYLLLGLTLSGFAVLLLLAMVNHRFSQTHLSSGQPLAYMAEGRGRLEAFPGDVYDGADGIAWVQSMSDKIAAEYHWQSYNKDNFSNCLLEQPTELRPCFFDVAWLDSPCRAEDSYGIIPDSGDTISPCFFVQITNATGWIPQPSHRSLKFGSGDRRFFGTFHPAFFNLGCSSITPPDLLDEVAFYPKRGFLLDFFPTLESDHYVNPGVWVQVRRVKPGSVVRVRCWVRTRNAHQLEQYTVQLTVNNSIEHLQNSWGRFPDNPHFSPSVN